SGGAFTSGSVEMDGGSLTAKDLTGIGSIAFNSGAISVTGPGGVTLGAGNPLAASLTLDSGKSLTVAGATSVLSGASLTVSGGAFSTGTLALNGGTYSAADLSGVSAVAFNSGTLELTGDLNYLAGGAVAQSIGAAGQIGVGRRLVVDGTATLATSLHV